MNEWNILNIIKNVKSVKQFSHLHLKIPGGTNMEPDTLLSLYHASSVAALMWLNIAKIMVQM